MNARSKSLVLFSFHIIYCIALRIFPPAICSLSDNTVRIKSDYYKISIIHSNKMNDYGRIKESSVGGSAGFV